MNPICDRCKCRLGTVKIISNIIFVLFSLLHVLGIYFFHLNSLALPQIHLIKEYWPYSMFYRGGIKLKSLIWCTFLTTAQIGQDDLVKSTGRKKCQQTVLYVKV